MLIATFMLALTPLLWPWRRLRSGVADTVPTVFGIGAYLAVLFPAYFIGVVVGGTITGSYASAFAERLGFDGRLLTLVSVIFGVALTTIVLCAAAYLAAYGLVSAIGALVRPRPNRRV